MADEYCPYCKFNIGEYRNDNQIFSDDGDVDEDECPECGESILVRTSITVDIEVEPLFLEKCHKCNEEMNWDSFQGLYYCFCKFAETGKVVTKNAKGEIANDG